MGDLQRYGKYIANGLVLHKMLQLLESIGVLIQPYFFYQENLHLHLDLSRGARFDGYHFSEVGPGQVEGIAGLDPNSDSRDSILHEFRLGRRCFALRHHGRIVAASWCDTHEINFTPLRRRLEHHEAYLYRTETLYAYRGRDVAAFLRSKIYDLLLADDRDVLYSYTDYFNHSAVRFKKKIGARVLFVGLHVRLFGSKWKNWKLTRHNVVSRPWATPPQTV